MHSDNFAIALILLIIFIRIKRPNRREEYRLTNISIIGLESFDFLENKTIPEYHYDILGITGNLRLDCFTGICIQQIFHKSTGKFCYEDYCEYYGNSWTEYKRIIAHNCSEQCYETGNNKWNCNEPYNKIGSCINKTNDKSKEDKVCYVYKAIFLEREKIY